MNALRLRRMNSKVLWRVHGLTRFGGPSGTFTSSCNLFVSPLSLCDQCLRHMNSNILWRAYVPTHFCDSKGFFTCARPHASHHHITSANCHLGPFIHDSAPAPHERHCAVVRIGAHTVCGLHRKFQRRAVNTSDCVLKYNIALVCAFPELLSACFLLSL